MTPHEKARAVISGNDPQSGQFRAPGQPAVHPQISPDFSRHWPPVFQPNAVKAHPPVPGRPIVQRQISGADAGSHWPASQLNAVRVSPPIPGQPIVQRQISGADAGRHWPPAFQPNTVRASPPIPGQPIVQRQTSRAEAGRHWPPVFQPTAVKSPLPASEQPAVQRQTSRAEAGRHWPPVFQPNPVKSPLPGSGQPAVQRQTLLPHAAPQHVQAVRVVQRNGGKSAGKDSGDAAGSLLKLAAPQVFEGPAVEVQKELVQRLEAIKDLPDAVFGLGAILLPLDLSLDHEALIKASRVIPTPRPSLTDCSEIVTSDPRMQKLVVTNTISTMYRAGQIDYLRRLTNKGDWRVVVECHYFRSRPKSMVGFHKDTLGETIFFNLNFATEHEIAGPEYILNPPSADEHDQLINTTLGDEIFGHIKAAQKVLPVPTTIEATKIPPHGAVAVLDELAHHSTPLYGHRTVPLDAVRDFVANRLFNTALRVTRPGDVALEILMIRRTIRLTQRDDDQYGRPDLLRAGLSNNEIDDLMSRYDPGGNERFPFEQVQIPKMPADKKYVAVRGSDHPALVRQMSKLSLLGELPPEVTGDRRFFRTWVRIVPAEDIVLTLLSKGQKSRAVAKTLNVRKKEVGGLLRRLPDRIASGDRRPNTNLVDTVFLDKRDKRRKRILKPLGIPESDLKKLLGMEV